MSDRQPAPANRAVFLSYASQDAEAVERIADALRVVGVEVWFDQNELVGGDAWDAKIRKQISECGLFVPVISANTQARDEGYFRLEWKLAVDRSHLMAHDKAFLLPVVIDATTDAARVPPEFRAVQWTRLPLRQAQGSEQPGGEVSAAFCARVKTLLGGSVVGPVGDRAAVGASLDDARGRGRAAPLQTTSRPWSVPAIIGVGLLVAIAAYFTLRPRRSPEEIAKLIASAQTVAANATAKSAPATMPLTEAQQLVAKARKILDEGDEFNRETYMLAEELLKKSEALDLTDASAWSLHAELSSRMFQYGLDYSPARREALQSQADRAAKLAPGTPEAEIALAYAQIVTRQDISALQERLTKLADKFPNDSHLNRVLSFAGMWNSDVEVAIAATQRALKRAPDDPELKADLFYILARHSKYAEAEQAMRGALTGRRTVRLWSVDWILKLTWRADVDGAVAAVEQFPSWNLAEDRGCSEAAMTYLWARKPAQMLGVLGKFPRDYFRSSAFYGPRAVLTAWAHEAANENEAALADWRIVAQLADRELVNTPDDTWAMHWKAWALARLGDRDSARKYLRILEERNADISNGISKFIGNFAGLALVADSKDEAIARLTRYIASGETSALGKLRPLTRAMLRVNPLLESLHGDPRFEALVAKAPGPEEKTTAPAAVSADEKSVAVLAFADNSPGRDSEYFSDGISEELINALGKVPGLKVPARTSSFYFKGKSVPVPEIAKQLGVAYVIEGSVQRAGDKVKISARLSKAADGFQMWTDSFLRDAKDVFAVEEEIAGLIAKSLSLKLGVSSTAATAAVNPQAFEAYLQGRQAWNRRTSEGYTAADAFFARAIALDPNFARAYVGQADVLDVGGWDDGSVGPWDQRNSETLKKIHGLLERAIALDPDLAEAYASLGGSLYDGWNYPAALPEARRAVQLNSNYATGWHWLGEILWDRGEIDEALADLHHAADLDPFSPAIAAAYSLCLRDAGRTREALAAAERAVNLQPGTPRAMGAKALALLDLGRKSEAAQIARELLNSEDGRGWWQTGTIVVRAGLQDEAGKLLEQYRKLGNERLAAPLFAQLGHDDEFLAVWQKYPIATNQPWYLWEPRVDPMRGNPNFLRVLDQVGLTEAHARVQAWRQAHAPEKPAMK